MMRRTLGLGIGAAIALVGCAIGPDYEPPQPKMPEAFQQASELGDVQAPETGEQVSLAAWWRRFDDETLHSLVTEAIEKNHDVAIALLRVAEAREAERQALSDLLPGTQVQAGYESASITGTASPVRPAHGFHYEGYTAGLNYLWEIDIFGRLRRAREQRIDELQGSVASLDDAVRMLVSQVVTTYLQLRSADEQIGMVQKSIDIQLSSLKLVQTQMQAGAATDLDVARSEAQLAQERALLPPIDKTRKQAVYRLAVLCGEHPENFAPLLKEVKPLPLFRGTVAVEAPARLLRRRPDLRAAERALAAATANIGYTEGQLFPIVTVSGNLGVEATRPDRWFQGGAGNYAFMPTIKWTPFDTGTLRAQLRASNDRAEEALHTYDQAVLTALEETEDALTSFGSAERARDELVAASTSSGRALELARVEYSAGAKDYLTVLDAQRTHLDSELGRVRAQADLELALVDVFRAFGGGWEVGSHIEATQDVRAETNPAVATTGPDTATRHE